MKSDLNDFSWWQPACDLLDPPPEMTVSEWADRYRRIPPEFAAEPGGWATERAPFMREVMDACSPSSQYRRIVLVKPTQSGGTEAAILNTIGHTIDLNPRSILVVFPTIQLAQDFSSERLEPMIRSTPVLANKVSEPSSVTRFKEGVQQLNTVKKKRYPGGFLNMVGPTGLSSRPVPIVIMDEVDDVIKNAATSSNPTRLLTARTTTFFDRKEIFISSPSNEPDESGIIQMWQDSTQGKLQTRCPNPNCHYYQSLEWEQIDYDHATLACSQCHQQFKQWDWQEQPLRWLHVNSSHLTTIGFWMGGLNSPWLDWEADLITEWREANRMMQMGDESLMRVFYNTKLARSYRARSRSVEIDLYHDRREVYACHSKGVEVPEGVVLLTAAVDVQDSYLAYDITGWGRGRESWGIETGEFQGDPRRDPIVWDYIDKFVYRRILNYEDGTYTRIRLIFVDSGGHCTTDVYKYCKPRHPRMFAIKGVGGPKPHPIIIGGRMRDTNTGCWLIRVGSDALKEEFHSRLAIERPGPGYCHWPMLPNGMPACGYNEDYFQQLLTERRVLEFDKHGFARYAWDKARMDQNEAFDLRCYNRAALEYLRVRLEQMPRDQLRRINQSQIEKVEIGLGRAIYVESQNAKSNSPRRADRRQHVSTIAGFGAETSSPISAPGAAKRRSAASYGTGATSSF